MTDSEEEFSDFVVAASPALLRTAWLLTGSTSAAQDLVQTALLRCWTRWSRVHNRDHPEGYARKVMFSTFLTARRRLWRSEIPFSDVPDQPVEGDAAAEADLRAIIRASLAELSQKQRAVMVLRYFDDLPEAEIARVMGISVGSVKTHASRALARLRGEPRLASLWNEEVAQ